MRLVNHVAVLFNTLQDKQPSRVKSGLHPMNCLLLVDSGEAFGLVSSPHTASYGGLLEIKDETIPETDLFLQELDARAAEMDWWPAVGSNSTQATSDETNVTNRTEPMSGDSSIRKGKRKALGMAESIETNPDHDDPLNVSATASVPPVDNLKRRRLDQPHVPTASESCMSWLHNGDDLPVRNHI
jgi:hypothetical protein